MLFPTGVGRDVVPLGDEYRIDDDGFRSSHAASTKQQALSDLSPGVSLVVLGEPGIGKSRALRELAAVDANATVVAIGLETVTDARDLQERLAAVDAATTAADSVTLVLDSIDECPVSAKAIAHHLDSVLRRHPEVRVLLGCRTADWPQSLGTRLRTLHPGFEIVELLPLSRADIATLAASRGIDGDAFIQAVVEAAAAPLAALPLTLDLLLTLYAQTGQLPSSAAELYEQGLLLLVDEPDPDREPGKKPAGSAPQRLSVAAKLAAYTMLCGRSAIARSVSGSEDDLLAGALAGGTEPIDGGDVAVTAELVEATLSTAVFTGRGEGRLGVVHASIAAYLTARYLTTHAVPEHQLRALLTRTNSLGRTRVPSRLRETAAWMVAIDPDRNRWLVDVDPDSLAAHAGLVNVPPVRQALVAHLLDTPHPELRTARRRWRLGHPGLAEQLRPALRAPLTQDAGPHFGHPLSRRARVAVEIARRAGGHGSVPDLVDLVGCSTTNSYLRSSAAYALLDLDAGAATRVLRGVLDEVIAHPDHDPDDELRGLALEATWPTALTASELVAALSHPQNSDLIGGYAAFLSRFLDDVLGVRLGEGSGPRHGVDDQAITDLVRAITPVPGGASSGAGDDWVDEDNPPDGTVTSPPPTLMIGTRRGARVMTTLLNRALGSSQLDGMIDEVGWLLATALQHHQDVTVPDRFGDPGAAPDKPDADLRRRLVLATLRHLPADLAGLVVIRVHGSHTRGLVTSADLEWLLSLGATEWEAHAARVLPFVFDATDVTQQDLVWSHRGQPIVDESVGRWFDAVELDSDAAAQMRERHAWSLDRARTWEGAAAHEPALQAAWSACRNGGARRIPAPVRCASSRPRDW